MAQKLRSFVHAVVNEKLLGRLIQAFLEYFGQIALIQAAEGSHIPDSGCAVLIILLHERESFCPCDKQC